MTRTAFGVELHRTGIVAVLRGGDVPLAVLVRTGDALIRSGVTCLELTMNTARALDAVAALRADHGEAEIGVGTVRSATDVAAASRAGAMFVVCPDVRPEVGEAAHAAGLAWYPGALTPTEVTTAWDAGAAAVKLFPASLGGPRYVRELRAPLPDIPLVPTGGVALDTVADFRAAGALAVGLGSPLLGDALAGGSGDELRRRARVAVAAAGRPS